MPVSNQRLQRAWPYGHPSGRAFQNFQISLIAAKNVIFQDSSDDNHAFRFAQGGMEFKNNNSLIKHSEYLYLQSIWMDKGMETKFQISQPDQWQADVIIALCCEDENPATQ